ncbi:calcium-binding protein [Sphingomonas sabuli]|uniref:Calcium-binding protein n=1 Tax=Sphingomonas sabuli TaxID=2764186 RepID=A0A7G9L2R4_9SPHN|nr:calcium-binding protein [Sphingomonas sabuli]QNM82913.1 calcium-binding protein [Sphingomonas sabuli]
MPQFITYFGLDMRAFAESGAAIHERIAGGTLTASTTSYRIDQTGGDYDIFVGYFLGATSSNLPHSGTITGWGHAYTSSGPSTPYWSFDGLATNASTISTYILNDDFAGLLSNVLLSFDDTVTGSRYDDWLLGFGGNDTIYGGAGNDTLDGGEGDNLLNGGSGDDTYYASDADSITEYDDEGTDTVILRSAQEFQVYALGDNVEILRNQSGAAVSMVGNDLSNLIYGGDEVPERLDGQSGNDYLNGGSGADIMHGGAGDDIFVVDSIGDVVTDQTYFMPTAGGGIDEVRASISFSLSGETTADIENLRLTGGDAIDGTGNWLNNELTGNGAANVLNGAGGSDIMRGNDGNDIYYVDSDGDRAIESSALGGIDTVRASISFTLGNHVENLQLTGANIVSGVGNALANRISGNNQINVLVGNDGNDVLRGNGGNDILDGGAGVDTISGGTGQDWIDGGAGRDLMTGGAEADTFVFEAGDFGGLSAGSCDRILDFSQADSDQIRLNTIDANSANGSTTNEAFAFIGSAAFHGISGELRSVQSGGNTYVLGDTDGDKVADFMIRLDGLHSLTSGDFLL